MILQSKGLQESFLAPQFKSINSLILCLLVDPTLTSIRDYWKDHSFDYTDLCWQTSVFAFNTLSRFVIAFLLKIRYVPASHRPVNTSRTNERMSQKLGGGLRPLVQLPSLKSSLLRTPVRSGIRATVAKGKDVFLTAALAGNSRFLKMRLPKKQESSRKTSILLY